MRPAELRRSCYDSRGIERVPPVGSITGCSRLAESSRPDHRRRGLLPRRGPPRGAVRDAHWSRLEPRLERNLDGQRWSCSRATRRGPPSSSSAASPRRSRSSFGGSSSAGHEVASRGYWPRATRGMSERGVPRGSAPRHARRSRRRAPTASLGYRSPTWIGQRELWKLDVLAEEGYLYDASINPKLWSFAGHPECNGVYEHRHRALRLWEFPVATVGPRCHAASDQRRQLHPADPPHAAAAPRGTRRSPHDDTARLLLHALGARLRPAADPGDLGAAAPAPLPKPRQDALGDGGLPRAGTGSSASRTTCRWTTRRSSRKSGRRATAAAASS